MLSDQQSALFKDSEEKSIMFFDVIDRSVITSYSHSHSQFEVYVSTIHQAP